MLSLAREYDDDFVFVFVFFRRRRLCRFGLKNLGTTLLLPLLTDG